MRLKQIQRQRWRWRWRWRQQQRHHLRYITRLWTGSLLLDAKATDLTEQIEATNERTNGEKQKRVWDTARKLFSNSHIMPIKPLNGKMEKWSRAHTHTHSTREKDLVAPSSQINSYRPSFSKYKQNQIHNTKRSQSIHSNANERAREEKKRERDISFLNLSIDTINRGN